jgi:2-polyprenyl-6-methoxyphenol hydroxylase-like FAD-dependent oxidoreductase
MSLTSPSVLIVGAGPVGLVAAIELARRDIPIRIIDAASSPNTEPRAVVLHARSLELLDAIGVVDRVIETGQYTRGLEFHAGDASGKVDLTGVDSPYPFSVSLPQTQTEQLLRERLTELGVSVEYGVTLSGLSQDADGVNAELRRSEGRISSICVPWLIASDGAHSTVRHLLGQQLEGTFKGEHFLMGDVEAEYGLDHERMHMFFPADQGPELAFPMVGRRLRLIAQIDESEGQREATIEWLQSVSTDRGVPVTIESSHWLTTFEIRHAQAEQYRTGRVFLAGDAAHVHSPAGGQGMNTGMQDAFNLGWKLALVARGAASESLLESYQAERHPIAAHIIAFTTDLTRVGTVRSPILRGIRGVAFGIISRLDPIQRRISRQVEEINVAYRDSAIVAGPSRGALRAGDAAPRVARTDAWLDLHRSDLGHVALTFGSASLVTLPDGVRAVHVTDPAITTRYGLANGVVLVRPDGYIGLIAPGVDRAALDAAVSAYFDRISHAVSVESSE